MEESVEEGRGVGAGVVAPCGDYYGGEGDQALYEDLWRRQREQLSQESSKPPVET